MNITEFSDKEIQVIALMVPEMEPEAAVNKVLRDWFNSNLSRLPGAVATAADAVDSVIAVHTQKAAELSAAQAQV